MNRKLSFPMILLATVSILSSCKDGTTGDQSSKYTITASNIRNIPQGTQIDKVRFLIWDASTGEEIIIAETSFINNGFSIQIPQVLDEKYLSPADEWWIPDVDPSIQISAEPSIEAMYRGELVGFFYLFDEDDNIASWFMYVTAPFKLTGLASIYSYDIDFDTGWNQYASFQDSQTGYWHYTTVIPSGLIWYFRL